ncbi:hypothetical protein M3Y94_01156500 [Aphelenchoides besseyi]|nr:hypothetical protein M3Y94_01156500 [Aphelenchoides besseyi]KAI6228019.1 hypothetical protein M3Y95_00578200 [Aphelenchoides besseyi]
MSTSSLVFCLLQLLILVFCGTLVDGYTVRRFVRDTNPTFPQLRYISATDFDEQTSADQPIDIIRRLPTRRSVAVRQNEGAIRVRPNDALSETLALRSYVKKSQRFGYKAALKKFNGNGGRNNCFFTPIQCLIQQDFKKFKKLIDTPDTKLLVGNAERRAIEATRIA